MVDIQRDDLSCAEDFCRLHRAHTYRTCTDDRNGIARGDFGKLRTKISAGNDVAQKQGILIRNAVGDFAKSHIRKRNADKFCLTAIDTAAKFPSALFAVIDITLTAEPAIAAEGDAVCSDVVADCKMVDI